jgi:hypothetical protein
MTMNAKKSRDTSHADEAQRLLKLLALLSALGR